MRPRGAKSNRPPLAPIRSRVVRGKCVASRPRAQVPRVLAARLGASRTILVLAPSPDDDRIEPAHEAIAFWNERLEELGVETRLAGPRLVVASPVTRALENYARSVAQRGVRLPGGEAEPDAPRELTGLDADVVVLLSRQDILSYTWPLPRIDPPRYYTVPLFHPCAGPAPPGGQLGCNPLGAGA